MCFGGCLHAERLMRSAVVVERDPVGDHSRGVLLGLEAMTMDALLFQGTAARAPDAVDLRRADAGGAVATPGLG